MNTQAELNRRYVEAVMKIRLLIDNLKDESQDDESYTRFCLQEDAQNAIRACDNEAANDELIRIEEGDDEIAAYKRIIQILFR